MYLIAKYYLEEFKKFDIDTMILGCTHYPFLKKIISKVLGENVFIVDSAIETSKKIKEILIDMNILNIQKEPPAYQFFVSDDKQEFLNFINKIFNFNFIVNIEQVNLN